MSDDTAQSADGTMQCELCGGGVDDLTLTTDSHPEGVNHLVGECCTV